MTKLIDKNNKIIAEVMNYNKIAFNKIKRKPKPKPWMHN